MKIQNLSKSVIIVIVISLTIPIFSCSQRIADFTIISSKNIDLSRAAQYKRSGNRVKDEHMVFVLLGIPFEQPNLKEAMDKAIEKIPGCIALVDGVVYSKVGGCFPYLGTMGYVIEGSPLIDPKLALKEMPTNYILATYNKEKDTFSVKYISKEEYNLLSKTYKYESNILARF